MIKSVVVIVTITTLFRNSPATKIIRKEYGDPPIESNDVLGKDVPLQESELYWRPYVNGSVPNDAILVGSRNDHGQKESLYIGQVDVPINGAQVQSVSISNNSVYVTNTYSRTIYLKDSVRILCSNSTNLGRIITWIPADKADKFNPDEDFVVTGHERSMVTSSNANLYTGRATVDGVLVVGKIVMGSRSFRFYFAQEYMDRLLKSDYEILGYTRALSKLKESD